MSNIDKILAYNREYVASKGYEKHLTDYENMLKRGEIEL